MTIGVHPVCQKSDFGVINVDSDGNVSEYLEKPETVRLASMGVYACEPEILTYIESGVRLDLPNLVQRLLVDRHRVTSYLWNGYWIDIGNPEDYARACTVFSERPDLFLSGDFVCRGSK